MDTIKAKLLVKICKLYYLQDRSQKEIAALLGISRPQISRLLSLAREQGIVHIDIHDPFERESRLETALTAKYGLGGAYVVETNELSDEEALRRVASEAAGALMGMFRDGDCIGVMAGRTIRATAESVPAAQERRSLTFVPLVGGYGPAQTGWHANSNAALFAQKTGGAALVLNAPASVRSAEAMQSILNEPEIDHVLSAARRCAVFVIGIGPVDASSAIVQAGYLTEAEMELIRGRSAVANIGTSFLNEKGEILDLGLPSLKNIIGLGLENLKGARGTVCIGFGAAKAAAIRAALRGGWIDTLVTDVETARSLTEA